MPSLQNRTASSSLTSFVCSCHPRKPSEILERLCKQFTCHSRALGILIAAKFLSDAIGLGESVSRGRKGFLLRRVPLADR